MQAKLVMGAMVLAGLAGCGPKSESLGRMRGAPPSLAITTELRNASGEALGSAVVTQETAGVRVVADVRGLPPGEYAIHLHAIGKCETPGFTSAGPHFNPAMKQHGHLNPAGEHAGDLPNITVGGDGRGHLEADRPGLQMTAGTAPLLDADGAAVVLHAAADDYRTDPSGNAGGRVACGVLVNRAQSAG
ncbi:hypothetical protein IP88_01225 [alpha proteobacterium AAP81b]|nr:hypothetical protein IP88_01225 [alpha proteobacterium AAP81b]